MTSGEEEAYHQGMASMSTVAALEDGFTPAPPKGPLNVTEPARETQVHAVTEVLVVGGGPAGCAAALAARSAGAEVVLVERYNHLGGLSTGGLVIWTTPRPPAEASRTASIPAGCGPAWTLPAGSPSSATIRSRTGS